MMKRSLIAILFTGAACSGSPPPRPPATTAAVDPVPMREGEPVPPTAATPPATPASPAETPAAPPVAPAPPGPEVVKANLRAAEMAAYERAKPVFDTYCAACHSKDGAKQSEAKRRHFDMSTYPFGGHHAMEVHDEIREVLGLTGKKPTMPADRKGAVKGDELALIAAWADAFQASHEGGAHEGHGGHGGHAGHGAAGSHQAHGTASPAPEKARERARKPAARPRPAPKAPASPASEGGGHGGHDAHGGHDGHGAHGGHKH